MPESNAHSIFCQRGGVLSKKAIIQSNIGALAQALHGEMKNEGPT
jgi:hypothetical protein